MSQAFAENEIISLINPEVLAIPIQECHDPMIDLQGQDKIRFGGSPEIPNNTDYTKIRKQVYLKIIEAQNRLPKELRFCLYEGYRSLGLQRQLFENRYQELHAKYSSWDHKKLFLETAKLVSPVINLDGFHNIPPHSTGGAIDIYLINDSGEIVDMGIEVAQWMNDTDGSISKTSSEKISQEAKHYRKILSDALEKSDFVNYPGEYWHWSYGDRYWAYQKNKGFAIYSSL
jgi:D-alanyl-D-alanine dipeptidase